MRHGSLHIHFVYKYVKLYVYGMNIKRDILVQKVKVKNSYFFANYYTTHKLR